MADYTATSGTLTWADGDSSEKTITAPILDNTVYGGNKTFTVTLSDVTAAILGSPNAAAVTIVKNEAVNASPQIFVVSPAGAETRIATSADGFFRHYRDR